MDLTKLLTGGLLDSLIELISKKLNIEEEKVRSIVTIGIPVLLKALSKNTKDPKEAEEVSEAIAEDHDGSILGDLTSLFGDDTQTDGGKILKHILGEKLPSTTKTIAEKTDTKSVDVKNILVTLAPLIMGTLGRQQKEENLDTEGTKQLIEQTADQAEESFDVGGMLTQFLDQDNDGSVIDDVAGMVGKFLKKK